jgi:hypothetical protein
VHPEDVELYDNGDGQSGVGDNVDTEDPGIDDDYDGEARRDQRELFRGLSNLNSTSTPGSAGPVKSHATPARLLTGQDFYPAEFPNGRKHIGSRTVGALSAPRLHGLRVMPTGAAWAGAVLGHTVDDVCGDLALGQSAVVVAVEVVAVQVVVRSRRRPVKRT